MGKFSGLALNVTAAERMPILDPRTLQPIVEIGPDGKPIEGKEAYLELLHEDSERGLEMLRKMTKKEFKKKRRTVKEKMETAVDDALEAEVDKIAGLCTGWYLVSLDGQPILDPDTGKPIAFNEENLRDFLSDQTMAWVRRQALAFVADAANFIKASSQS